MKKRFLSFILVFSILLTLIAALPITASAAESGTCGDNLKWTLSDDGVLTISGSGAMTNWESGSMAPWYSSRSSISKIEIGSGVTSIGAYAFYYCNALKSIIISNSVTVIGNYAFYDCRGLTGVTIPNSVKSIGDRAFWECISLTSATIGNSVTSIGECAFAYCSRLKSIIIPNSVTSIGERAFAYCSNLTSATLSNSVTSTGNYTFYCCTELTSVTIPNGVTSIGNQAFNGCNSLTSITIPESVTSIGFKAFYECFSLASITIPNGVTSIDNEAFYNCSSLTSITIPDGVTSIGKNMFEYSGLTSVTIPNSVTSVGWCAFSGCFSLTDVYYSGSEEEWNNISITTGNNYLTEAVIHYNYKAASSGTTNSIKNSATANLSLTVYENKKDSSEAKDSYRLSGGATVTNGVSSGKTDKKGIALIKNDGSSVTVSKENYVSRTITAARAEKAKKIYLQKDTGEKPIIQAVWIGDTDVYSSEYGIDITSSDSVTLNAEVVWKSGTQSRIYLMQDARRAEFSGTTLTTVLSDSFDVSKTIYIVAEDTAGNATKKALKFKADGGVSDALDDYKLSFGDSVTGTIPGSVPVIGGSRVGLDLPMIPLTVTFEDNKFYAVLGLDVAKASDEYSFIKNINGNSTGTHEKETKYLFENIKDGFKASAGKYSFSKMKTKWNKAKYNYTATTGFEADLTVIGYIEGYVDSNGEVSILDGGVGINPSVGISVGSQIIPVPPIYWEASMKGEIEAMLNIYLSESAKNFTPNGSVGGDVTLKGGVGLGASGVIGISGGVEGNIGVDWDIYTDKQDYVAVSGSIGAYVKAFAGPITIIDKSFPFANGIIWDHPSTRVSMFSMPDEVDFYNISEYSLTDRSYAEQESYFVANDGEIMLFAAAPQNKIENTLKTNVYPYSEPKLAEFSDGTMLAVWLDDDITRSAINRTSVFYSYYNGTKWSDPEQISNDGTGDYSPDLEVINDTAYITWVNANSELSDDAEITEIFNVWEISAAVFDKEDGVFTNISTVTDDSSIDMTPQIFGDESGVQLAWVQNSSDDIFSEANTYSIITSTLSDGEWSEALAYADGLMPIDSLDGCVYNGDTYIAYTVDLDGNQQDYTDKEIYLNNIRLTENTVLDSKPVFANGSLYYYSNGTIAEYDLSDGTVTTVISSISTDRFDVISDGENAAVVYGQSDSLITELYAVIYDAANDRWGESIALTQLGANISSYSGVFSQNGEMEFIINKTEASADINSETPYGQTDISLFSVTPAYNLSMGEVFYHEELLLTGNTLEFYTEITNNGELTVDDYVVQVSDKEGNVLASTYSKEEILPGETVEFTAYYPLGDDGFVPHSVTLTVIPADVTDFDDSDNSAELYLTYDNISLEKLDYGIDSDGNAVIYGDIVNRGYSTADTVTASLRKDSPDGEIVDSVTIDNELNTLDLAVVSFTVPFEEEAVYYVELDQSGQNSDFVVLQSEEADESEDKEGITGFDNNSVTVSSLKDISSAELIAALYQGGKLLEVKSQTVSIAQGENTFACPTTDCKNADTMKIMVWSDLTEMVPLFDVCTVDLGKDIVYSYSGNTFTVSSENAVSEAKFIAALYRDGMLLEAKSQTVSLEQGKNTLNNPITDYKNADTMKVMVWSGSDEIKPLFDSCTVSLD